MIDLRYKYALIVEGNYYTLLRDVHYQSKDVPFHGVGFDAMEDTELYIVENGLIEKELNIKNLEL
jgi:hypothetical protein